MFVKRMMPTSSRRLRSLAFEYIEMNKEQFGDVMESGYEITRIDSSR